MAENVSILREIQAGLKREYQLNNWLKELDDKIQKLQRQQEHAQKELDDVQSLFNDHSDVVEVAREMVGLGETMRGRGDDEIRVYNPKYVTRKDKKELLFKILKDYHLETQERDGMPFGIIKEVLGHRYGIVTRSTGDFFRFELLDYELDGGKRNRRVLFPSAIFESVNEKQ